MENDFGDRYSRRKSYDEGGDNKGYAMSGRIMLSTIVTLFFVMIVMVFLHLYARWYLIQARRSRFRRRRRQGRTRFVFYVDPTNQPNAAHSRGLDAAVLKSLPVFVYSSKTHAHTMDCAVCLSEFEENESGRVLPKCNHSFHIDCIDMWFHSHSTCPLCRSTVELVKGQAEKPGLRVEPGSSSEAEPTAGDSSASQGSSFVSSLKRMISGDKKGNSTASGNAVDIERGREEIER